MTVPSADRPSCERRDLLADQGVGGDAGCRLTELPGRGEDGRTVGLERGIGHRLLERLLERQVQGGQRSVDVGLGDAAELRARAAGGRLRVGDLEEERVLAARDDGDRACFHVAVRPAVDGRHLDAGPGREDGQADQLGPWHGDRGLRPEAHPGRGRARRFPAGMRLVLVGSRFSKRTVPVALVSSTRLPVALNVLLTETGIEISLAGTTPRVGSGWVAVVSATIGHGDRADPLGLGRDRDRRRRQQQVDPDGADEQGKSQDGATDQPGRPDTAARSQPVGECGEWTPVGCAGRLGRRSRTRVAGDLGVDVDRGADRVAGRPGDGAGSGSSPRPRPRPGRRDRGSRPKPVRSLPPAPRSPRRRRSPRQRPARGRRDHARRHDRHRRRRPRIVVVRPGRRRLVLGDRGEDRQPGRRSQGACRRIPGHDRQPLVVGQRIARQEPEVDPRRRDARAVRQDDRDPRRIGGADACRRGRDLVVDLEIDDPAGHGQTFIARSTRRSATSSASSDVCSSIAW